jgi:hypothetical protein
MRMCVVDSQHRYGVCAWGTRVRHAWVGMQEGAKDWIDSSVFHSPSRHGSPGSDQLTREPLHTHAAPVTGLLDWVTEQPHERGVVRPVLHHEFREQRRSIKK